MLASRGSVLFSQLSGRKMGTATRTQLFGARGGGSVNSKGWLARRTVFRAVAAPESEETEEVTTQNSLEDVIDFLKEDLMNLFNDKGIDASGYDDVVEFQDPITSYNSLGGYVFNIAVLKRLFAPTFELHDIKQTSDTEITSRWTMTMRMTWNGPLRGYWDPKLVFTGISIYGVNLENRKINKHIDLWDSIDDQQYFSFEAFQHVLSQVLNFSRTPALETVSYGVLKKKAIYEIRKYPEFLVVETNMKNESTGGGYVNPAVDGSSAFNRLAGYIFGKNEGQEKMNMTTPVFSTSAGKMQFVIGSKYEGVPSMPEPKESNVERKSVSGGLYAVVSFNGLALEADVDREQEKLEKAMIVDGLKPGKEWILARYNEPFTNPIARRNEILIPIEDGFSLW